MYSTIRRRYAEHGILSATYWLIGAPYRVVVKQTSNFLGLLRLPISIVHLALGRVGSLLRLGVSIVHLALVRSVRSLGIRHHKDSIKGLFKDQKVYDNLGKEFHDKIQKLVATSSVIQRTLFAKPLSGIDEGDPLSDTSESRGLIVFLAPVDWSFRIQRPQHLATEFARTGYEVVYVNPTLYYLPIRGIRALANDINGVQIVNLVGKQGSLTGRYFGTSLMNDELADSISQCLRRIAKKHSLGQPQVLILQQPGWIPVAARLSEMRIVADWMDLHRGFTAINEDVTSNEHVSWWLPDAVNCTSTPILEELQLSPSQVTAVIPNACDPDHWLDKNPGRGVSVRDVPTVGYFGAVADWFDTEPLVALHRDVPEIQIDVVGAITDESARSTLQSLERVRLLNEIPYQNLPEQVRSWSVGLIPFKINDLIRATNPVKLFEYASLGIPIVATPIPEVVRAAELVAGVYVATPAEFPTVVRRALAERDSVVGDLKKFAAQNTWRERAGAFERLFIDHIRVSIVVLMWNNANLTIACLESVVTRSGYGNLDIILVDNGSDFTQIEVVSNWISENCRNEIHIIRNSNNLGFAAGMNEGIKVATGDYIVLLNNDTQVTYGWVRKMIRHFRRNSNIGILGPLTDHCGNEAQIKLPIGDWSRTGPKMVQGRVSCAKLAQSLGFFCVMISREVVEGVGLLSEEYGQGYFEDDDYCNRVREFGKKCAIAQDVFIHHEMSASFDQLQTEARRKLFDRNKAVFEAKWGAWTPHSYDYVGEEV